MCTIGAVTSWAWFLVGAILVIAGTVGVAWSAPQLTHGLVEIPGHWWSTLASVPLLVGAVILLVMGLRRRTRSRPGSSSG